MATMHGNNGSAAVGANAIAELTGWSLNTGVNLADDTAIGDASDSFVAGTKNWSASVNGHFDDTDTNGQGAMIEGASITINLQPEGSTTGDYLFTGTALVESAQVQMALNGIIQFTASLRGTGDLTRSTVA